MEHTKELLSVPLSALIASPFNVRRYTGGQVEELEVQRRDERDPGCVARDEGEIGDSRCGETHGYPLRSIQPFRQHQDTEQDVEQRTDEVREAHFEHVVMIDCPREADPIDGDEKCAGGQPNQHALTRYGCP